MKEPSYAIQKAVFDALTAASVCPGKIKHRIPAGMALPYVLIGQDQILDASEDGGNMFECHVTVYAYAETLPQLKLLSSDIYAALYQWLTLDGFNMYELHYSGTYFRTETDGDAQTEQAVIDFIYKVEALP